VLKSIIFEAPVTIVIEPLLKVTDWPRKQILVPSERQSRCGDPIVRVATEVAVAAPTPTDPLKRNNPPRTLKAVTWPPLEAPIPALFDPAALKVPL
jgi:hypothetical protein